MLDLGLEHLDVDVGSVGDAGTKAVDRVVKACGESECLFFRFIFGLGFRRMSGDGSV